MKIITFSEIENYLIIDSIDNATPDPEETKTKVEAIIAENPDILFKKTVDELFVENAIFFRLGKGQKYVDDTEGEKIKSKLADLGPQEKLLLSGDTITDQRNQEYWIEQAGAWNKQKIERLGETLPQNAVLLDALSPTQQQEIAEQNEATRIANLTPAQKTVELEKALTAVKQEVRYLKEEAEIAGESFDAKKEYQLRKAKVEEKYNK